MPQKKNLATESSGELVAGLKRKVNTVVGERQADIGYLRGLGGSKHVWDAACDDVFDAVEGVFVQTVIGGKALDEEADVYDAIGEIAWAVVTFLDETAPQRLELDAVISAKCEELVKGKSWRKRTRRGRTRVRTGV
jgi:hypothetical protein